MAVILSNDEVAALRRAIDSYLPELQYEVARIKLPRDRHDLAAIERTLVALRTRLDREEVSEVRVP